MEIMDLGQKSRFTNKKPGVSMLPSSSVEDSESSPASSFVLISGALDAGPFILTGALPEPSTCCVQLCKCSGTPSSGSRVAASSSHNTTLANVAHSALRSRTILMYSARFTVAHQALLRHCKLRVKMMLMIILWFLHRTPRNGRGQPILAYRPFHHLMR